MSRGFRFLQQGTRRARSSSVRQERAREKESYCLRALPSIKRERELQPATPPFPAKMLKTNVAVDDAFDAADFHRTLVRGLGTDRHTASARVSSRSTAAVAAATSALEAFVSAAALARSSPHAPDVVAAYVALSPGVPELFAGLWLSAARPGAAAAAAAAIGVVVKYAEKPRTKEGGEGARGVVKDVVKGRAPAMWEALMAGANVAGRVLEVLAEVVGVRPLLAKEAVNRFEFGSAALCERLCWGKGAGKGKGKKKGGGAEGTRAKFVRLLVVLLNCGDHDVVWALATRTRGALVAVVKSFGEEMGEGGGDSAGRAALDDLLAALETRVLASPAGVAREAFEAPMLESLSVLSFGEGHIGAARELFFNVIEAGGIVVPTAHVARVLGTVPVGEGDSALGFVLDAIGRCPRAARMLLQIGGFVKSAPRLSSAWLASAAVICRCVRELRTPTPIFSRAKFLEKCWAHESDMVRHYGLLVAAELCRVILKQPEPADIARIFLPAVSVVEAVLKKCGDSDDVVHFVYGCYRGLFLKEFEDSKADAIRIAMDAGTGKSALCLSSVVRASLTVSPDSALATLFHRKVFSVLLKECASSNSQTSNDELQFLLREILLATRLFPPGTETETDIWLQACERIGRRNPDTFADFESFVSKAWGQPYALFDDLFELSGDEPSSRVLSGAKEVPHDGNTASLLSAAALRRLDKIGSSGQSKVKEGSLSDVLLSVLSEVEKRCPSEALASKFRAKLLPFSRDTCNNDFTELSKCVLNFIEDASGAAAAGKDGEAALALKDFVNISTSETVGGVVKRYVRGDVPDGEGGLNDVKLGSSAGTLALLLNLACHESAVVEPLIRSRLEILLAAVQKSDHKELTSFAVTYSAALLRAPVSADSRHTALQVLFIAAKQDDENRLLSRELDEFVRRSFAESLVYGGSRDADISSGKDAILDDAQVVELISSFAYGRQSLDFALTVETYCLLVGHFDPRIQALSRQTLASACVDSAVFFDFGKLSVLQSSFFARVAAKVPAVRDDVVKFVSSSKDLSLDALLVVMPALSAAMAESRTDDTLISALAPIVLPVLLGSEAIKTQFGSRSGLASACIENSILRALSMFLASPAKGRTSKLLTNLWKAQEEAWNSNNSTFSLDTVSCVTLTAMPELASTDQASGTELTVLVDLLVAFPIGRLQTESEAISLLFVLVKLATNRNILSGLNMKRIEGLEVAVRTFMLQAANCLNFFPVSARVDLCKIISTCLQLDLMLDKIIGDLLKSLAGFIGGSRDEVPRDIVDPQFVSSLGLVISLAVRRLPQLSLDEMVAKHLFAFEAFFSLPMIFNATLSEQDKNIFDAMRSIAKVLKSSSARLTHRLPERRSGWFHVDASDVVGMFDARRIDVTSTLLPGEQAMSGVKEVYDPVFVLTVLRKAAREAKNRPKTAVLDLDLVARSGLIGLAVAGLACEKESIRLHSFAALHALAEAVGPESGVSRDAAAALYRDRKQLAFMLNLLRMSIRTPLQPVLPLFAAFYRSALAVVLRPTHSAYREVTRFLLRTPRHNVLDADGLSCLLKEDSDSCRLLAIDILRLGLCSSSDHHVARRRHMYDIAFMLGSQFPEKVLDMFTAVVYRGDGQVAADLVRGQGILSWLLGTAFEVADAVVLGKRLALLEALALSLPSGVLCSRYHPFFTKVLEALVEGENAEVTDVVKAARAVAKLVPNKRRQFFLPTFYRKSDVAMNVYSRQVGNGTNTVDTNFIVALLLSCKKSEESAENGLTENGVQLFPGNDMEREVILSYVAEIAMKDAEKVGSKSVRGALACLILDARAGVVPGSLLIACLSVVPVEKWTAEMHQIADELPSQVASDVEDKISVPVSGEVRQVLVDLLLQRSTHGRKRGVTQQSASKSKRVKLAK